MKPILRLSMLLLVLSSCAEKVTPEGTTTLFVGTYTEGDSEGIYSLQFNPETGTLDSMELKAQLPNPSFLAISGDKSHLYAVQETADFDSVGGGITAFAIDNNQLKVLNSKGSGGAHPCHVALSENGQLAVSNYTGGNLSIYDLLEDGSLGIQQLIDHNILDSTKTSHAHMAIFKKNSLFVSDLGLDAVKQYAHGSVVWEPAAQHSIDLPVSAGPRHLTFNTDGSFLYVINELNATITVFQKDEAGNYLAIQTESTVAANWEGAKSCADIHLSPDGRFLYGSNRGENTIVIFEVDQLTGKIRLLGRESVRGDWPRNFTLSPDGNHLLVANQYSNNITVFKRDLESGMLEYSTEIKMPNPVCLVFL